MGPPIKQNKQAFGAANAIGKQNLFESSSEAMFTNLWVGNLAADVTDSDLRNLFEKHGVVDNVTCYPSRSYAFVNMRRAEDAKRAKESVQGFVLRGFALKIDFAKPAKPCKSLWVSNISNSTSKEDLEEELSKFGKIEDFKFIRDKNTAYIDYSRLDDASKALKTMNGKKRGGTVIRVDFLRSQPKRDQGPDAKEGQHFRSIHDSPWLPPDAVKNYPDSSYYGPKRQQQQILPMEGRKGEQPSNMLVISYPPIVRIDEQMLHNAMILFGEIDNIRSFPSRHYSLVEFRSIEEAQLAKDGLQGRLFNDPRILIMYHSANDQNDLTGFQMPGMFNEPQLDVYGHPFGPPMTMRPFDSLLQGPPEYNMPPPMGGWRRSSPVNVNPSPGSWDAFDHREPKRMRSDQDAYGGGGGGRSGSRGGTGGDEYIWRGVIAKGGTPVCHARCVPIRDWIGSEIPEVVNCSARTGLDMLAKHYTDAIGFDIVFFLPDSEQDFASYTEFVRYLGDRNRAGVAKFDDGTTLFLVPPSDFLSNVLHVKGPERLYGVVLRFPQPPNPPSVPQPQYIDKQQIPPPPPPPQSLQNDGYNNITMPGGEKVVQIDYSGAVPHDDLNSPVPPPTSTAAGISLTPELIATLASLAKGKFNNDNNNNNGATSAERPWEYGPEPSNFSGQQAQPPGYGNFPPGQDVNFAMQQGHSGHFASQQYFPQSSGGFGYEHKPDAIYGYQSQSMGMGGEQKTDAPLAGSQVYGSYQPGSMGGGENSGEQLQSALFAAASQQQQQQPPVVEIDADKNERYQSTLQFATNLLLQIHQQQPGQGGASLH